VGAAGIVIDNKSGLELTGLNVGGIKVLAESTRTLATLGKTTVAVNGGTNVHLTGLRLEGGTFVTNLLGMDRCVDCVISENRTTGGGMNAAIISVGGVRTKILGNVVSSTVGSARGYWIGNVNSVEMESDPQVEGNRCAQTTATCYVITANGGSVVRNIAEGSGGSGFAFSAAQASGGSTSNVIVNSNIAKSNLYHGFQSDSSLVTDRTRGLTFTHNLAMQNAHSGFYVVRTTDWVLSDNVARDNGTTGFQVEDSSQSTLNRNQACETRVGPSRTQRSGFMINSQQSTNGTRDVMLLQNVAFNHVHDGLLITNSFPGTGSNFTVDGNTLTRNGGRGLYVVPASEGGVSHVAVSNNVATGNGAVDIEIRSSSAAVGSNQFGTIVLHPEIQ
jgi:parallel beta-helix repeat protein